MKIYLSDQLKKEIELDLRRPCKVSYERIGFIYGNCVNDTILLDEYVPIDDSSYIKSDLYGAVFDKEAIKKALRRIMTSKKSCFQIHEHSKLFGSQFSQADLTTAIELCETFNNFNSNVVHGSIVMCEDELNVVYISTDGIIKEKLIERGENDDF